MRQVGLITVVEQEHYNECIIYSTIDDVHDSRENNINDIQKQFELQNVRSLWIESYFLNFFHLILKILFIV